MTVHVGEDDDGLPTIHAHTSRDTVEVIVTKDIFGDSHESIKTNHEATDYLHCGLEGPTDHADDDGDDVGADDVDDAAAAIVDDFRVITAD